MLILCSFNLAMDLQLIALQISPTFSSGKMRRMHPIIVDCVHKLIEVLEKKTSKNGAQIPVKKMMSNLTMDVIARCAFGTEIDAHSGESNEFVENAKKQIQGGWRLWTFFLVIVTFPKLIEWTDFKGVDPEVTKFFRTVVSN